MEITINELKSENKEDYILVDLRKESERQFGIIDNALVFDYESDDINIFNKYKNKKIVFICRHGIFSQEVVEKFKSIGFNACSLKGGYSAYLIDKMKLKKSSEQNINEKAEESIRKKFKKELLSKFAKALNKYELIKEGEHIACCMSGGKDSFLMAKLFNEIQKHKKMNFKVSYIVMDPGYNDINRKVIEENAKNLNIDIKIFNTDIFQSVYNISQNPCYICARMRRGYLYNYAKSIGANKIALGHHFDDVIETVLMGILYGGQIQNMMPKLKSTNFENMELIRPMYLIREDDIKRWRDYNNLNFIQCACKFTDTCTSCNNNETKSKRLEIKNLIKNLKQKNPYVETNIFKSMENVCLDTVIEYKSKGKRYSFLESYDEKK